MKKSIAIPALRTTWAKEEKEERGTKPAFFYLWPVLCPANTCPVDVVRERRVVQELYRGPDQIPKLELSGTNKVMCRKIAVIDFQLCTPKNGAELWGMPWHVDGNGKRRNVTDEDGEKHCCSTGKTNKPNSV